jgi:hypothetical protein
METQLKLNFSVIQKNYPNSVILDIIETFYPEKGWCDTENTVTTYTSIQEVERRIKLRIFNGATHFNFKIRDEFDVIRYPDYMVKELLKY